MPFAIIVEGKLLIDTVYEHASLSKFHYLAFNTGDYDQHDFDYGENKLDPNVEFAFYPDARIVRVAVQTVDQLH